MIPATYIEDLLNPELSREAICEKYKISVQAEARWRRSRFVAEKLVELQATQIAAAKAVLKDAAVDAAINLVKLTDPRYRETARKACLDVLAGAGLDLRAESEDYPPTESESDFLMRVIKGGQASQEEAASGS